MFSLRGAAPLQHTLMQGRTRSGITLQTLHPELLDHGTILAQRTFTIPNEGDCDLAQLVTYAAPRAADLLVDGLTRRLFDQTLREPWIPLSETPLVASQAPKLTSADACINWQTWSTKRILCTQRAINTLWSTLPPGVDKSRRMRWHGLSPLQNFLLTPRRPGRFEILASESKDFSQTKLRRHLLFPEWCYGQERSKQLQPGQVNLDDAHEDDVDGIEAFIKDGNNCCKVAGVWTCDGHFLRADSVTIAGGPKNLDVLEAFRTLQREMKSSGGYGKHLHSIK